MKHLNMYQIAGSCPEDEGFNTMDDVAMGIDHYEHYSGITLTIKRSKLGQYCQYGCRFHDHLVMKDKVLF